MLVIFGPPISVQFLSNPCFICQIPYFIRQYISSIFHCSGNVHNRVPVYFLCSVAKYSMHMMRERGGGRVTQVVKKCAGAHKKLFWRANYCAKPRPYTGYQSGSWSCSGMGRRSPWIVLEYNLATVIVIWPLTQSRKFERGSSIFVAMS